MVSTGGGGGGGGGGHVPLLLPLGSGTEFQQWAAEIYFVIVSNYFHLIWSVSLIFICDCL